MAPLAPCFQVIARTVFRMVIKVSHRQNNARSGFRMRLSILSAAIWICWRTFAAIACGFTDAQADGLPVFRVARFILGAYRHRSLPRLPHHGVDQAQNVFAANKYMMIK